MAEFIDYETLIKVASTEFIWLWVAIEPENSQILAVIISRERNKFVPKRDSCQELSESTENGQFPQIVTHDTQWLVSFSDSITIFILL